MQHHHFISGLPRSGSTLLAALLKQNPNFHASMSSPVAALVNGCLEQIGAGSEYYTFFDETKRKSLTHAIFSSYYEDHRSKSVIFDTNRIWTARMHQLVELFDDFKMICCVRNPAWIMDSFEKIYRKNPFDYSRMFNPASRMTVYSRCESLMNANGTAGKAWTALKEAFYGEYSERLLLIDYDLLTQYPERTLSLVYDFLGEKEFQHNFENIDYQESEFDDTLGVKGLHTVRKKVEHIVRKTILPPDLFAKYSEMVFWGDDVGTNASIIAPKKNV